MTKPTARGLIFVANPEPVAARHVVSGVGLPFAAVVQMLPSTFSPRSFLQQALVPSVTKSFFFILCWLPGIICSVNFWGGGLPEDDIDLVSDPYNCGFSNEQCFPVDDGEDDDGCLLPLAISCLL